MTGSREFLHQFPPRGDPQLPPPYEFRNTDMRVYLVRAAGDRLSMLCERYFNRRLRDHGRAERIRPLLSLTGEGFVSIALLHYGEMRSVAPGYAGLGYSSQNELVLSLPVVRTGTGGMPMDIGVFVPYLAVDNALSLICGREVIGYPKVAGSFRMPASLATQADCRVDVLAADGTGENALNRLRTLIEFAAPARASPGATAARSARPLSELDHGARRALWPFGHVSALYDAQGPLAMDPATRQLISASAGVAVSNFSFKQFRDAGLPAAACYQAIVRSRMRLLQFHGAGLLDDARIVLHAFPRLDLAATLGLATRSDGGLDVLGGYTMSADLRLDSVSNLLTTCATGEAGFPRRKCTPVPCADLVTAPLRCYVEAARAWVRMLDNLGASHRCRTRSSRKRA